VILPHFTVEDHGEGGGHHAEPPRQKGLRPEEDEFRLSLPLQTIEDRVVHRTPTIEQG